MITVDLLRFSYPRQIAIVMSLLVQPVVALLLYRKFNNGLVMSAA